MKDKIFREKKKEEEKAIRDQIIAKNRKEQIRRKKLEEDKYDPNGRLEVESSRSDEPYIEKVILGKLGSRD